MLEYIRLNKLWEFLLKQNIINDDTVTTGSGIELDPQAITISWSSVTLSEVTPEEVREINETLSTHLKKYDRLLWALWEIELKVFPWY